MSLGFHNTRRIKMTNLPGSVGNSLMVRRNLSPAAASLDARRGSDSLRPTTSMSSFPSIRDASRRTAETPWEGKKDLPRIAAPPPVSILRTALPSSSPLPLPEEGHWVYATCTTSLVDEDDGGAVAEEGDTVVLVYPMREDSETGRVTMRAKTVDAVTGQLRYRRVVVYESGGEERRNVHSFRLVA